MDLVIKKPWGHENIKEKNDLYVVKQLFIRANERLSLQYHEEKDETIMLVHGKATIEKQPLICYQHEPNLIPEKMVPFRPYHITPGLVHRIAVEEDTHIVEVSSPQLDDVVRLQDDYARPLGLQRDPIIDGIAKEKALGFELQLEKPTGEETKDDKSN